MSATVRVLLSTVFAITVISIGLGSVFAISAGSELLSEHSRPAVTVPAEPVAIVEGGKTFHDPKCIYMHGKPEMVSAEEAIKKGYTPCIRCMRKALQK